jgi:thioredoxin reductase (NADPH)
MSGNNHVDHDRHGHYGLADSKAKIEDVLADLPLDILIYLFFNKNQKDIFTQGAREIIQFFQGISKKIKFKEFTLDHPEAKKRGVTHAPTLLFNPDQFQIRWLGAPMGEEGRTFLQALILLGLGKSGLAEQAAKIIKRINTLRQVKIFVSATCPYCPQQAVNAVKAAIENPKFISIELIDIQAQQDLARKYNAQSVPQTFANEIQIGLGAQPEEIFAASLEKLQEQTIFIPENDAPEIATDLVIVGGGPAGLTAGIYAMRSGIKTVVIEKGALGGQIATTPVVENYPGFTQIGGKTLVDILANHALQYVQIFPGEEVMDIEPGDLFKVTTTRRRLPAFRCGRRDQAGRPGRQLLQHL